MKHFLTLYFFGVITIVSCQESKKTNPAQTTQLLPPFAVGFQIVKKTDSSRTYKPDTDRKDTLHFRSLDIDVWYPAQKTATDTLLSFGYLLGLLESRANFYSAPKKFNGLTQDIAKSFCDVFQCSHPDTLLTFTTQSRKNARVLSGKFPLIVYVTSYNGMSYENFALFELLARQGYVVVSVSSIGRYPGDMTMKTSDLMEQVHDASFIIRQMKKQAYIDSTRIGIIGYSWGGLAGSVLAMQHSDTKAVVSLDGSEFHRYGLAKEEDQDFDATVNSDFFKKSSLSMPYLRLESNPQPDSARRDSVYDFWSKATGEKKIFKIISANHQDFSCLPSVVKSSGNCEVTPPVYASISALTLHYFDAQLRNQPELFDQNLNAELGKTIMDVSPRK